MHQFFTPPRQGSGVLRSVCLSVSLSVCVCVVCLSVLEHRPISGTDGPIVTKCFVQVPCGRSSVLLWRRCDTSCTSGLLMTSRLAVIGRMAMRGAIPGRSLISTNALFLFVA